MPGPYRRVVILLVRPSKYDDEGYVVRHWRGTIPSNTLSCLTSLSEDVIESGALGDVEARLERIDETVTRVDPAALGRRFRREGTKVVVGLVGVQTNQFPRAADLAHQFKRQGFDVIVGGFHVSGSIALSPGMPPECQDLVDAGVTLVLGEVEGRWAGILQDALGDRLRPLYDYLASPPDLTDVPLPRPSRRSLKGAVPGQVGSIDAGRGCPFACSFCSIITVQGRRVRARSAARIIEQVREDYHLPGKRSIRHYFFTDDNFARNPNWEAVFDGLIRLREEEGVAIDFMMQVDTQATRIAGFVEKAARAGCVQVFIGMESLREDNLKAGGKGQNRTGDYRDMIARWHEVGVVCHAGFIIGFPYDTRARVLEDVRALAETLLVDQASFFMLTPIPGSRDHQAAVEAGTVLDGDYGNYDSFHATFEHPRMSREEWQQAFRDAWTEFYSFEHMRRVLLAQNPHTYWAVLKNLIWYRAAMIEGTHPMITGFFRLKDRKSRRATFPIERRLPFFRRRAREVTGVLAGYLRICWEMQQLWLLTRIRRDDYWFLGDLRRLGPRSMHSAKLAWARVHAAVGLRLAALRDRPGGRAAVPSPTISERLDAVHAALGSRLDTLRQGMAGRAQAVRARIDAARVGAGRVDPALAVQAALADLRLPELPPAAPPSSMSQRMRRLNPFALDPMEHDPALVAYWRRTRHTLARLAVWRVNPVALVANLVRGARQALVFLVALSGERY